MHFKIISTKFFIATILTCVYLLGSVNQVLAQEKITLKQATEIALQNNLQIKQVQLSEALSDENLNFLIGILGACKLSLSDIALLNFGKSRDINYKTLQERFRPGIILFFGVDPAILEFPLQFPHYQLQSYNKQTYLSAPALDVLAADKQQKQQLWASLKKLFSI